MCSTYLDGEGSFMGKYYQGQGDLADILRPTVHRVRSDSRQQAASTTIEDSDLDWGFPMQHDDPAILHGGEVEDYDFGDPCSCIKDPLLHELELVIPGSSSFFGSSISEEYAINPVDNRGVDLYVPHRMSSTLVTAGTFESLIESPLAHTEAMNPNSKVQLMDTDMDMQISAQNSSMKRRKGQAKKVVCIPAPAAVNGRTGGEAVPSDLWAWRKYGQKPIKGSPYPRGYYRCSSSKGCSARKQVERSRTDPNMLVITYTSEHNHPWPTQRNALAGSTRATQSSIKNNGGSNEGPKVSSSNSPRRDQRQRRDKRPNEAPTRETSAGVCLGSFVKEENERSEEGETGGPNRGRFDHDDDNDNDFMFPDLEGMDGGSDSFGFLLNAGEPAGSCWPKSCTAGLDSFVDFFDWSD